MKHSLWTHWIKYVLGRDIVGRGLMVFPDDAFIVSYPRSGSTWFRFLLGNLLWKDEPVTFHNVEHVIPDIHVNSSRFIRAVARPRLLKSHEYFDPRYQKVIYLVRDPRDVAVSYYRYYLKVRRFSETYSLQQYIPAFLSGELQEWGSWSQNVGSWLATRNGTAGFLLLRYEDLLRDPLSVLAEAAYFLGFSPRQDDLARAAELSSPELMRNLERTQGEEWITIKGSRPDVPFIGSATWGCWRTELPECSVVAIEAAWGCLMDSLGYERAQDSKPSGAEGIIRPSNLRSL